MGFEDTVFSQSENLKTIQPKAINPTPLNFQESSKTINVCISYNW